MAEAFAALDAYFWAVDADPQAHAPDSAHDNIFMMHDDDWTSLDQAWEHRPAGWREECAYVLGYGRPDHCLPRLCRALFDDAFSVSIEAACSFSAQVLTHRLHSSVAPEVEERLAHLLKAAGDRHVEEVRQLIEELHGRHGDPQG